MPKHQQSWQITKLQYKTVGQQAQDVTHGSQSEALTPSC